MITLAKTANQPAQSNHAKPIRLQSMLSVASLLRNREDLSGQLAIQSALERKDAEMYLSSRFNEFS